MKIRKLGILVFVCCGICMAACGSTRSDGFVSGKYYYPKQENEGDAQGAETSEENIAAMEQQGNTEMETETESKYGSDLFLITSNDMQQECLILEQLASGKQYMYYYSITTRFLDKYGNHTNVSDFEPGRIINIGKKDAQGRLLEAQISDRVWEYPDVKRYAIDEERGVFTIASTNYSFREDLFVHYDGNVQEIADLTGLDTLRIVGIDKEILSVSVTTGHGELKLENTDLFEGSFIQIGDNVFSEITPRMSMELPEGTYAVTVANNGYGGSTEVTIERGLETVLDLDTLKGEGPKMGSILFAVDVPGAVVQVDGKSVDYSEAVSLQYGVHSLVVMATGYDTYSKKLFVNSKEATIIVGLSQDADQLVDSAEDAKAEDADSAEESEDSQEAGKLAGSLAGSHSDSSNSGTGNTDSAASDAEIDAIVDSLLEEEDADSSADYLSTITELINALEN